LFNQVFQRLSRQADNFCAMSLATNIDRQHRPSSFIAHFEALGCQAETLLIPLVKTIVILSQVITLLILSFGVCEAMGGPVFALSVTYYS
jgi:hypothetical protein